MSPTLDGKLVVAISSRALFDFEEENRLFDAENPQAYMQLQLQRLDEPARPGVAQAGVVFQRVNLFQHLAAARQAFFASVGQAQPAGGAVQ